MTADFLAGLATAAALYLLTRPDRDIRNLLREINERTKRMSQELDDLTAAVAAETTIDQSAVALIQGLAAQIAGMGTAATDLAQLKAAIATKAAELKASGDALAAAVAANTPAPTPAP